MSMPKCNGGPDMPHKVWHHCAAMQIGHQWPPVRSASARRSAGRSQSIVEMNLAGKCLINVPGTDIV